MRWRWAAAAVGLGVLAAVGAGFVATSLDRAPAKPNVLVVLWDTVRADRLSLYGYSLDTSPRMKKWADEHGVVFERAVSPDMWTVPSHASLFTGLAPSSHGADLDHRWLDASHVTLAEVFAQNGWDTYAFSANPNLSPNRVNLLQGFERIDTSWGRWRKQVAAHTRDKLMRRDRSTEISPRSDAKNRATGHFFNAGPIAHEAFVQWLDSRPRDGKPFFAYLSYMEAHQPRVPNVDARRRVADDDTIRVALDTDFQLNNQLLYSYGKLTYTEAELAAINRTYDATLTELDDATADLLEDLDRRGVLDDTIVVFTADHGEQLGEHRLFGHRAGVYQALLHVPLVISYPKKLKPERIENPVSNLYLFSTILELAGVSGPETPYTRGNLFDEAKHAAKAIFSETLSIDREGFSVVKRFHPELTRDVWAYMYRSVVEGKEKLVQTVSFDTHEVVHCELYDLDADPQETADLYDQHPERAAALAQEIGDWKRSLPAYDRAGADAVPEDSEATKKMLEDLGYLEPTAGGAAPVVVADEASLASRCARRAEPIR